MVYAANTTNQVSGDFTSYKTIAGPLTVNRPSVTFEIKVSIKAQYIAIQRSDSGNWFQLCYLQVLP